MNEKNKKIIFFTTPAYGHMLSTMPVIKRLTGLGYEVDCYSSRKFETMIKKCGANFVEYAVDFEKYIFSEITSNFFELTKALVSLNEFAYKEYESKIDNQNVQLILFDSMCSFAKNLAAKKKIKSICFTTTLAYNLPVFLFSNLFTSTVRLYLKHAKKFQKLFKSERKFRKENCLPKLKIIDLFINSADETIVFSPKEFQPFCWTFPKSFHFAGTTIKDRKDIVEFSNDSIEEYDFYISFGTILTENMAEFKEWIDNSYIKEKKTIISAGNINLIKENKNRVVKSRVNQVELLPHCKYFITHAGMNSVYESIYFGVPQLCIPQQEEQRMVAKIVQKKKVGVYAKKYREKSFEKLEKIRESNEIKKWSKILQSYDGTENAVQIIEKLIKE